MDGNGSKVITSANFDTALYLNIADAGVCMVDTILIRTSSILKLDKTPMRFQSVPLKDDEEDILQCLICFWFAS